MSPSDCELFPGVRFDQRITLQKRLWQELRKFGDTGTTPADLAQYLLNSRLARGDLRRCAEYMGKLLQEMLNLTGGERVECIQGGRYRAIVL